MRLLRLLDANYAVVCTNPPYLVTSSVDQRVIAYVEANYASGRQDLYGAFIVACHRYALNNSRVPDLSLSVPF